jgi:hypothetical protein
MNPEKYLSMTIAEYRSILDPDTVAQQTWNSALRTLVENADWTSEGAHCLCELAERYGAFILRNATALAIVMNQEDGTIGL